MIDKTVVYLHREHDNIRYFFNKNIRYEYHC